MRKLALAILSAGFAAPGLACSPMTEGSLRHNSDAAAPYASKVMAVKAQLSQAARSGGKFVGA